VKRQAAEPPCTDPYARWCGRGEAVRLPPIPIPQIHLWVPSRTRHWSPVGTVESPITFRRWCPFSRPSGTLIPTCRRIPTVENGGLVSLSPFGTEAGIGIDTCILMRRMVSRLSSHNDAQSLCWTSRDDDPHHSSLGMAGSRSATARHAYERGGRRVIPRHLAQGLCIIMR
jgi:hypothetical protein